MDRTINEFIQPKEPDTGQGWSNDFLESLTQELTSHKYKFGVDSENLLAGKLTKEKLSEVQGKYTRPESCTNLVALKQTIHNP